MAETPQVDPVLSLTYDGDNHDQVLDFLREQAPTNPILRGGVVLEPAPGEPISIEVEYADGSGLKLVSGDAVSQDAMATIGVAGGAVVALPPIKGEPIA